MSRSLNSVIVRSGLVKLWKNPRVVKNYATYFTSYLVLYNVMQAILYSTFNYKIIDLKFYWINWLKKLIINIICFPYEDTSYSARLKTTKKDLLLKRFKENLLVTSKVDLEKEENIYKRISNYITSSTTSKTTTTNLKNANKFLLIKLQVLFLIKKLVNIKKNLTNKLKKLQMHSRVLTFKKIKDFRHFYQIFKTNSLLRQKRYRKASMSLAFLYTKYIKNIKSIKKLFDFCFDNNIIVLKNNYVNFVLNKIFPKVFVSKLITLQQKRNMPKKDLLVYVKTAVLKDLTTYKIILEKKLNIIITKIRVWLWHKINEKQKTQKKLYRMKILYIYFWFNIIKFANIETRIRQKIQSSLIANIKSLKAGKKIYVKPIINKITNLMQLLSNKMKTNTQYKDYLQNKYLLSKKTFYLLSQAKAANQAVFSKVNHGTLRYTNNTLFLKASRNSLILNYIRPLVKDHIKPKKHVVPSLLKQKYFQKLQAFSSDKLEIFKTLNSKNKIIFKIKSTLNLYKNNRFKILKPNTKLAPIKTYNLQSIPKQLFKVSKIRSNRAISLKLKEIFGKMKNRDLLLKNYVLKEIQRLVLTYVNLFQTAHKHYVNKKVNALQLQKFAAVKLKTKKNFVNKNWSIAEISVYRDQWWLYRSMHKHTKNNPSHQKLNQKNHTGVWLNFKLNLKKCQNLYKNEIKLLEYQAFMPLLYKTVQKVQRRKNVFLNVFLSELLGKNIQCLIFNPTTHYLIPRVNQRLNINHYKTLAMPRIHPHKANRYYLNTFNVVWHILTFKTEGMARLLAEHLARELRKDRRHYLVLQSITDIFEKVFQISKKNTPADLEHLRAIKIEVRGKIKGSERKRKYTQTLISNELPLLNHTATVDMAMASTDTVYGALGIKVWILYN